MQCPGQLFTPSTIYLTNMYLPTTLNLHISRTFSSEPCEALQTQTKRYIFYQPEKGYWMVLVSNSHLLWLKLVMVPTL